MALNASVKYTVEPILKGPSLEIFHRTTFLNSVSSHVLLHITGLSALQVNGFLGSVISCAPLDYMTEPCAHKGFLSCVSSHELLQIT
jgi:hypothetical protein